VASRLLREVAATRRRVGLRAEGGVVATAGEVLQVSDDIFVDDRSKKRPRPSMPTPGLLRQAVDVVSTARTMPLSASVLVARDELLELLQAALDLFPTSCARPVAVA